MNELNKDDLLNLKLLIGAFRFDDGDDKKYTYLYLQDKIDYLLQDLYRKENLKLIEMVSLKVINNHKKSHKDLFDNGYYTAMKHVHALLNNELD